MPTTLLYLAQQLPPSSRFGHHPPTTDSRPRYAIGLAASKEQLLAALTTIRAALTEVPYTNNGATKSKPATWLLPHLSAITIERSLRSTLAPFSLFPGTFFILPLSELQQHIETAIEAHTTSQHRATTNLSKNDKLWFKSLDKAKALETTQQIAKLPRPLRTPAISYLYIIQAGPTNHFKIGISQNPTKRLTHLQTASPEPLTIHATLPLPHTDARHLEAHLHSFLKPFRSRHRKGEWFTIEHSLTHSLLKQALLSYSPHSDYLPPPFDPLLLKP